VAAGLVMLLVTAAVAPEGNTRLWWVQLMATTFFGGSAMSYDVTSNILVAGASLHVAVSLFLGLVFGKITTSRNPLKLALYGLVLGGLCWLASNMFGPDLFDVATLSTFGQWARVFTFVSFGVVLGLFMSVASRALP
jgi:hypothetical protein